MFTLVAQSAPNPSSSVIDRIRSDIESHNFSAQLTFWALLPIISFSKPILAVTLLFGTWRATSNSEKKSHSHEDKQKILDLYDTAEQKAKVETLLDKVNIWAAQNPKHPIKFLKNQDSAGGPAYTLPNGTIYISDQLPLESVEFVLEHEKAHVDGHHVLKTVVLKIVTIAATIGILVLIIKKARHNPNRNKILAVGIPSYLVASSAMTYGELKYTKSNEFAADRVAATKCTKDQRENFITWLKDAQKKIYDLCVERSLDGLSDQEKRDAMDEIAKINSANIWSHPPAYDRMQAIRAISPAA